jgi:ectoine hydroxylase-related dioxygenase (phytanoyl-CoA dioxygenase family)
MYTLPHHVEFLSDEWLAEAEKVLRMGCERRKAELAPFGLSERFANAPPHLALSDNVAAWRCAWDGEALTVARGFDPDADLTVTGDYQAALMSAQVVGVTVPGVMGQSLREVRRVFGKDAMVMQGQLPDDAVQDMMGAFHDHMGRRTHENPDLAHRAARLGLTGKIRELDEQGYTVVERAISDEFADEVRAATLRSLAEQGVATMNWMLYHGREFERLVQNAQLMTLIDATLGRGAVIASFSAIRRGPGKGNIELHTDYAHVPEPYPDFSLTGVGVWALEDWTVASGPTWIIPGSHKLRRHPRRGEGHNGGVPIEMPKGSVVYFHKGVWHWQGDRTEPGERVTLHAHFNRGILRSLEPKRTDVQLMHRNPPRLGEMLGEDDWFDKLSAHGRDYARFGHMVKLHAFTDAKTREILAAG